MGDDVHPNTKPVTAYLLCIGFVGPEKSRSRSASEVEELLRDITRFRVADVAGKVALRLDGRELVVVFAGDHSAPLECAVGLANELNRHPDIRIRTGIGGGPVTWSSELDWRSDVTRETLDSVRRLTELGDSGHILISKRLAYELASNPQWDQHLYELDDFDTKAGRISAVNFYTDSIGNPDAPRKVSRQRDQSARSTKLKSFSGTAITFLVMLMLAALVAAGVVWVRRTLNVPAVATAAVEKSVLVLPFLDLSPARDQEYLASGIAEEILDQLATIKKLRVIRRSSAFAFKNKKVEAREIARRFNVEIFIRGTVRRDGNWIRVAAEIVNASANSTVWSKTFERETRDVPAIESEIAEAAARAVAAGPIGPSMDNGWGDPLTNDLYLQGLFLSHKTTDEDLEASADFFKLALDKNPKLGRAWTGTASDLIRLTQGGRLRPVDGYWRAQQAARSALNIAPHNADAHVYLGETLRILSWDLAGDEEELKRAFAEDGNSVPAELAAAALKEWSGLPNESQAHLRSAVYRDPLSPIAGHLDVLFHLHHDRLGQAEAAAQRLMEADPSYSYFERDLALVYREQGKLQQALDIYSRLVNVAPQPGLAITYARLGRSDDARKVLDGLIQRASRQYLPSDQIAAVYVALGENDEAFRWLKRAIEEHSVTVHNLGCGRDFRALRKDPRYPVLLRRIGLDPARFSSP
ncbi:MAG TPA: tetratricopeptide repeat protein [Chthoniobacterales bacterium]|nr:tetratricopeptide repeat protein [Chthoniobacterales bacterium]